MFEVWDRHRKEVIGVSETKKGAVWIGAQSLQIQPHRSLSDLVIRPVKEPPVRIFYINGQRTLNSPSLTSRNK